MANQKEMLHSGNLQAKAREEAPLPKTEDEPIFGKIEKIAMAYSEIDTDDLIAALTAFTEDNAD